VQAGRDHDRGRIVAIGSMDELRVQAGSEGATSRTSSSSSRPGRIARDDRAAARRGLVIVTGALPVIVRSELLSYGIGC